MKRLRLPEWLRTHAGLASYARMTTCVTSSCLVAACWISPQISQAALLDRGGGLIYDTVNNITWLQDADYAQTTGFHTTGRMSWYVAMSWAAGLSYNDAVRNTTWSDWRLPRARETELNEACYGFACSTSEVGHLYHIEGIKGGSPGPFINFKPTAYWTGTGRAPMPGHAWTFAFGVGPGEGIQDYTGPFEEHLVAFAWPVRDGDVISVPTEPEPEPEPTATPPPTEVPVSTNNDGGGGAFSELLLVLALLPGIAAVRRFARSIRQSNAF